MSKLQLEAGPSGTNAAEIAAASTRRRFLIAFNLNQTAFIVFFLTKQLHKLTNARCWSRSTSTFNHTKPLRPSMNI